MRKGKYIFDKCNVTPVTATKIHTKENCFQLVEFNIFFFFNI